MARKTIKTKNYTNHPQSKSEEVDVTQPGVIHIDDEAYFVDGVVAKFVLELLDEVDSYKGQLKAMENLTGAYGES
jgi:hypothetical protein|tara:strand:- start:535 stop:759 length:225 start_codon:yes stop_codon:yes gene_type:complete